MINGDYALFKSYHPLSNIIFYPIVKYFGDSAKYFQIPFFFLAVFSSLFLVYKTIGNKLKFKSNITFLLISMTLILITSLSFLAFANELGANVIDYILYPLMAYFYLKKGYGKFFILSGLALLNHHTGIIFFTAFLLHFIFFRRDSKKIMSLLILFEIIGIFFMVIWSYGYFLFLFNLQIFSHSPFYHEGYNLFNNIIWIPETIFSTIANLGIFIPFYVVVLLVSLTKNRPSGFNEEEKLFLLWILVLIPISFVILNRFVEYAIFPFSYLLLSLIFRRYDKT